MSAMIPYTYTVLRYVHDITTGECINVGVALYAPEVGYVGAKCRHSSSRLAKVFPGIDSKHFTASMKHIEKAVNKIDKKFSGAQFGKLTTIEDISKLVLPVDDSSLQWSAIGAGKTTKPEETLKQLFNRMVVPYEEKESTQKGRRSEQDVWKHFKRDLESRQLLQYFHPQKISVKDDEFEFKHTWKNGILHCLEPVSFDLASAGSIREKAHSWFGRIGSLQTAAKKEDFRIYFLVGQPQDSKLHDAYENAVSMLGRIPGGGAIVFNENQTDKLADTIAEEVTKHEAASAH